MCRIKRYFIFPHISYQKLNGVLLAFGGLPPSAHFAASLIARPPRYWHSMPITYVGLEAMCLQISTKRSLLFYWEGRFSFLKGWHDCARDEIRTRSGRLITCTYIGHQFGNQYGYQNWSQESRCLRVMGWEFRKTITRVSAIMYCIHTTDISPSKTSKNFQLGDSSITFLFLLMRPCISKEN